jgi:hypothetical protein
MTALPRVLEAAQSFIERRDLGDERASPPRPQG